MFKRKRLQYPRLAATALTDTAGIDSLKKLPVAELQAALVSAGEVEGWALSTVKGLEKQDPNDPLINAFIGAAMHSRIAREVMAIELVLRQEGKGHEGGPPDDTPPLGKNGQGKGGYI